MLFRLLKNWLPIVYNGLNDEVPLVRHIALFALGQFAECLQPAIKKYSAEILPVLFQNLAQIQANVDKNMEGSPTCHLTFPVCTLHYLSMIFWSLLSNQKPAFEKQIWFASRLFVSGMTKCYYAVEMFLDNLDQKDIVPHLAEIMDFLLTTLRDSPCYRVKELAVSAIGAAGRCPHIPSLQLNVFIWRQNHCFFLQRMQPRKRFVPTSIESSNISGTSSNRVKTKTMSKFRHKLLVRSRLILSYLFSPIKMMTSSRVCAVQIRWA